MGDRAARQSARRDDPFRPRSAFVPRPIHARPNPTELRRRLDVLKARRDLKWAIDDIDVASILIEVSMADSPTALSPTSTPSPGMSFTEETMYCGVGLFVACCG